MAQLRRWFVALLLGAQAAAGAGPPPAGPETVRAEFRAALEQVSDPAAPADSAALRGYLLFPYVGAARLRHALSRVAAGARDAALDRRIRAFLAAHVDEPVARELRREWLGFLGERAAWPEFQADAPAALTEVALQCHALSARLAAHDLDGVREAVLEIWLTQPGKAPEACAPLFRWLDTPDRLSDAETERRAIFAAQNRLPAPAALADLPPERRALMQQWDRLMAQPERELKRLATGAGGETTAPPAPELGAALLEAFTRVARRDSRQARALYPPLAKHRAFTDEQRQLLRRAYALGLAYDFDPDTVRVFRDLSEAALDPLSHEWRVRAALLHGEWRWALQWLEAMPGVQRQEPRWRYWRARMLERSHERSAPELYAEVAKEREYYAFLAAERLKRKPDLRPQAVAEDRATQDQLIALPAVQRARELFRCELPELAAAELREALRDRAAEIKAQAARMVAAWGWFEPAVLLLSELQQWDDLRLRFPLPYDPEIERAAKDTGLPGDWLYAVLRTESLYNPRAVSGAGALGLLQLRLPTARQVAQRAGLARPERDDLFKPAVNIALGARYLRELQERFGGRFVLALAAYNAGPQRIPDWLPKKAVDADIWIENIPYNETRTYVQRALSSLVILSWRRSGEPASLTPLLGEIAPGKGQ